MSSAKKISYFLETGSVRVLDVSGRGKSAHRAGRAFIGLDRAQERSQRLALSRGPSPEVARGDAGERSVHVADVREHGRARPGIPAAARTAGALRAGLRLARAVCGGAPAPDPVLYRVTPRAVGGRRAGAEGADGGRGPQECARRGRVVGGEWGGKEGGHEVELSEIRVQDANRECGKVDLMNREESASVGSRRRCGASEGGGEAWRYARIVVCSTLLRAEDNYLDPPGFWVDNVARDWMERRIPTMQSGASSSCALSPLREELA